MPLIRAGLLGGQETGATQLKSDPTEGSLLIDKLI